MNLKEINPLVLAYLGDSVYETYIRLFLVKKNIPNIGSLQKESLSYVTAKSQASILTRLIDANFFDEEELTIIRRARNTKGHKPPKGCDLATYHFATAFEAVIGYLYLKGDNEKIMNLMEKIENGVVMIVYGYNVAEAILKKEKNCKKIRKIVIQDSMMGKFAKLLPENVKSRTFYASKSEIDFLSKGLHQGIMIDMDYSYSSLNELLKKNPENIIILDHLEDPHNLGAIIRTAAASSFDGIIIPKDREVGVTSTVVKASVGTIFDMDVVQVTNIKNTIEELKKEGFWIVGTSMNGSDYRQIDYSGKIALVIGNEGKGMSKLVTDSCDFLASIPIASNVESLNASVAAGIMMYEVVRNRK